MNTNPPDTGMDNPQMGSVHDLHRKLIEQKFRFQEYDRVNSLPYTSSEKIFYLIKSFAFICFQFLIHNWRNIKNSKVNFCLGFFACLIVIVVVAATLTLLGKIGIIFLKLSEQASGQIDFHMTPESPYTESINFTNIQQILSPNKNLDYIAPRIHGPAIIYKHTTCSLVAGRKPPVICSEHLTQKGKRLKNLAKGAEQGILDVYLIDSELEKKMGLGTDWRLPPLPLGEAYLLKNEFAILDLEPNEIVYVRFEIASFIRHAWKATFPEEPDDSDYMQKGNWDMDHTDFKHEVIVPLKVTPWEIPGGKFPSNIDSGLILEYDQFMPLVSPYLDLTYWTVQDQEALNRTNLKHFARELFGNFPPNDRLDIYSSQNYDPIQTETTRLWSEALFAIDFEISNPELPILNQLILYNILSVFLSLIINVIICILLIISMVLIYSLLTANIETRTFELGILRALGSNRHELATLLLFQALSFASSYPLGLLIAQLLSLYFATTFSTLVGVDVDGTLTFYACLVAGILGCGMPLLAAILPIGSALGHNLHDALDVRQNKVKASEISIERSEDAGVSWPLVILGIILVVFGFTIYYLMPYGLLSLNLALLLYIFVGLLLSMLIGLSLFSLNIASPLNEALLIVLFFWDYAAIRSVITKNFIAHRNRNQKTTLLYSIALAFIVFISVSYTIQLNTFLYSVQQSNGCYLKVLSRDNAVIIGDTVKQLERTALDSEIVETFTWASHHITHALGMNEATISNLGRLSSDEDIYVKAIGPNYLDATLTEYLTIDDFDSDQSLFESLYTVEGSHGVVLGSYYKKFLGVGLGDPFLIDYHWNLPFTETSYANAPPPTYLPSSLPNQSWIIPRNQTQEGTWEGYTSSRLTSMGFLESCPGLTMSQFSKRYADVATSFTSWMRMSQRGFHTVQRIPMSDFLLKLKSSANNSAIDALVKELSGVVSGTGAEIFDYRESSKDIELATTLLSYFFNVITVVAMIVCFFSLNSSMYTNIMEQTKEIGIMRAMGASTFWIYRIYIYEAIVLIIGSSLLGILIGTAVGYTMAIQRSLFTQLPIPFVLPVGIIEVVFVCSVVFAVVASALPLRYLFQSSIVSNMRQV